MFFYNSSSNLFELSIFQTKQIFATHIPPPPRAAFYFFQFP